ncbi:MAG: hypothetical protein LBQ15_08760 [Clostridium sp.]|jgi:thymidylate kinase|nr:hypothetical protein [Clostridium sp.]
MFLAFEGIDGSGKTTLTKLVADRTDMTAVEKKATSSENIFVNEQIKKIYSANYPGYNGQYDPLLSFQYWTYLQCVWYSLVYDYSISKHLKNSCDVIVDGWYYKFCARKIQEETLSLDEAEKIFLHVHKPDQVILLDVSASVAAERKKEFTHFEAGGHIGKEFTVANFIEYQEGTRAVLLDFARLHDWIVLSVQPGDSAESIADLAVLAIRDKKQAVKPDRR